MIKVKNVLAVFPESFQKKCEAILNEPILGKRGLMKHKYNMGRLVQEAYELKLSYRKHIDIESILKEYFRLSSEREINRVHLLVNLFAWNEIEEIMKPATDGYCVGWGHFNFVMVDYLDKEQMVEYLQRAKEEHINSQDMYTIVKRENNRVDDPQNRKQIKSANQFIEVMHTYLSFCEDRDAILSDVSYNAFNRWSNLISQSEKDTIIRQLEDHIMACFMLKHKLQD